MLGFNAISTGPLSSFGLGRIIYIKTIEDLSLSTFENLVEENNVRIRKIINVLDSVKAFRDWEVIQINGSVNWQDLDTVKRNRKSS